MLYDLVASDFDMTLCPPGGVVGERTRAAIRRVREAGAHFTVVSGRTTAGLLHNLALQRIDLEGMYVIGFNGAAVAQAWDGAHIVSRTLDADLAAEVVRQARQHPVDVMIPHEDLIHTEAPERLFPQHEARSNATALNMVTDLAATGIAPHKVLIGGDPPQLAAVARELAQQFRDVAEVVLSAPFLLEVTARGVTKGTALAAMSEALGIDPQRTLAFGDNHNDIPMIVQAGLGVAVGNAVPELLAAADRVTGTCEDEGVADVLDELFPPGSSHQLGSSYQ